MQHFHSYTSGGITIEEMNSPILAHVVTPPQQSEKAYALLHITRPDNMSYRDFVNPNRIQSALSEIAHYLTLRERTDNITFESVIGVTHSRLARLAVRHFGFVASDLHPTAETTELLRDLGPPHTIQMDRGAFGDMFQRGRPAYNTEMHARINSLLDISRPVEPEDIERAARQAMLDAIDDRAKDVDLRRSLQRFRQTEVDDHDARQFARNSLEALRALEALEP
jgi:hypothetical protein